MSSSGALFAEERREHGRTFQPLVRHQLEAPMKQIKKHAFLWLSALLLLFSATVQRLTAGEETVAAPPSSDFYKFYLSARRADDGRSIYWIIPPKIKPGDPCHPDSIRKLGQPEGITEDRLTLGGPIPCLAPNLNPPFFTLLLTPITKLHYELAWWIWAAISTAATIASMWLIIKTFYTELKKQTLGTALLCALMLLYYPNFTDFTLGQVGSVLLLFITLAWRDLRNEHEYRMGLWLGIAASLKPFLLILALPILAQRNWKALIAFGSTAALALSAGLLWYGWPIHADYKEVANHVTWTASNWNASLIGFVNRAFSSFDSSEHPWVRTAVTGISVVLCAITLGWCTWMCARTRKLPITDRADHFFMHTIPATLLISPLAWLYYLPWLCLPAAALWHLSQSHPAARTMKLALFASMVATIFPILMKSIPTPRNPTIWWGHDSLYFYALTAASIVFFSSARLIAFGTSRMHLKEPS